MALVLSQAPYLENLVLVVVLVSESKAVYPMIQALLLTDDTIEITRYREAILAGLCYPDERHRGKVSKPGSFDQGLTRLAGKTITNQS